MPRFSSYVQLCERYGDVQRVDMGARIKCVERRKILLLSLDKCAEPLQLELTLHFSKWHL